MPDVRAWLPEVGTEDCCGARGNRFQAYVQPDASNVEAFRVGGAHVNEVCATCPIRLPAKDKPKSEKNIIAPEIQTAMTPQSHRRPLVRFGPKAVTRPITGSDHRGGTGDWHHDASGMRMSIVLPLKTKQQDAMANLGPVIPAAMTCKRADALRRPEGFPHRMHAIRVGLYERSRPDPAHVARCLAQAARSERTTWSGRPAGSDWSVPRRARPRSIRDHGPAGGQSTGSSDRKPSRPKRLREARGIQMLAPDGVMQRWPRVRDLTRL